MKITDFCKSEVEGWDRIPDEFLLADRPDQSIGFLRQDGLNVIASIKEDHIHLSIAAMESLLPNLNAEQRLLFAESKTGEIMTTFFGDRKWEKLPNDPRRPHIRQHQSRLM
jgi:hypothetical protein